MSNTEKARCGRCWGRCVCAGFLAGTMFVVPIALSYFEAKDGQSLGSFEVPGNISSTATAMATGSLSTSVIIQTLDTSLDHPIEAPGPGFKSMMQAVHSEQFKVTFELTVPKEDTGGDDASA